MPQITHFKYDSADGVTKIHAVEWIPEGPVRGVLQIAHGMQEFIERYDELAGFLNDHGVVVVGNDHLGHGDSIRSEHYWGYFARSEGNKMLLADMRELQRITQEKYHGVPYILLGHSMGSLLARQYLCIHGKWLDGAIICGTGWHSALETRFGMAFCRVLALFFGWEHRSRLVTRMVMGNFNKKFEPVRTPQDWLSTDQTVVDAYRADHRTRFTFTLNGYYNLLYSIHYLTKPKNLAKMPKDLPVFFIAGEEDPVGNYGLGVKQAVVSVRAAGVKQVECRLYPNDRHEILNERNRQDVYQDIWEWIQPLLEKNERR